jgi:biotin-(acetyl-CoA carboxylase) ligase
VIDGGRCRFLRQQVEVRRADETLRGLAVDVDANGALMMTDRHGHTHLLDIAEMFL